ncbi:MAG TPA: 50S ribosomal protein L10 [Deltaproteobacteria bacterium]|nr:MAG: 50S ribosomal protein L10 [Deltaproteobacteria bacterium GWA2_45_12]HBF13484.1 50S ribosomal protein L10 [Deltaproteobacteria bacterium]
MNREQKAIEIENLKAKFLKSQLTIVADYKGMTVDAINQLRRKLEEKQSSLKVIKNRLAKIAVKGTPSEFLAQYFIGTTAVATSELDPTGPAKVIVEFSKNNELIKFKGAVMGSQAMSSEQIKTLASLPSKEELIAKAMGSMLAPARNWVCVLAQIPRQVVNVLAAIRDQKEKSS